MLTVFFRRFLSQEFHEIELNPDGFAVYFIGDRVQLACDPRPRRRITHEESAALPQTPADSA
jgi:hypothetical protein